MVGFTVRVDLRGVALAGECDGHSLRCGAKFKEARHRAHFTHLTYLAHLANPAYGQPQAAIVQISQLGPDRLAMEFKLETARHRAMRAPAVAAAEGVGAFSRFLRQQRAGDRGSRRERPAHGLLLEQQRPLSFDQRRVEIGLRKGRAADDVAQELHIGRQADDMRPRQRLVEPGQCLLARVAVHDELGDHRVVER